MNSQEEGRTEEGNEVLMYGVCQKKWQLGNRGTLEITLRR